MKKIMGFLCAVISITVLFSGCANQKSEAPADGKLKIVATIFPQYDIARQIGEDRVDATMLLSVGDESHDLEPTLEDVALVEACDIFLYTGSENWVEDIFSSIGDAKTPASLALMDCVKLKKEEDQAEHSHEQAEAHSGYDEHVWTSPKNMIAITEQICGLFCETDPQNAQFYRQNAQRYLAQLRDLDQTLTDLVANAQRNTIVFEGRFPFRYLCGDYGIDYYAALLGCAADTEVSLSTISFLIDKVDELSLPIVFYLEFSDEAIADTICEATGAEKRPLHSCHNVSQEDFASGVTYVDLMNRNIKNLEEALN